MKAEIYTKDNCFHCTRAKRLFEQRGIEYTELSAVDLRESLIERVVEASGLPPKSVPQIWLGNEYIGGADQLVEYFARFDAADQA